jgi:hypothetical protein
MTHAALSAGFLWLGWRMVMLLAGNVVRLNPGAYSVGSTAAKPRPILTGCGCMTWMDGGPEGCAL